MTNNIVLATTQPEDLNAFFEFQLDKEANYLAAFNSKDPTDKVAYLEKWTRLLADPTIHIKTINVDGTIVGSVSKYVMEGHAEITYWLDRKWWGQGVGSAALEAFLKIERVRPVYGRVAFDNFASQKIMEKCGFVRTGKQKGFANGRQMEIVEYVYQLT